MPDEQLHLGKVCIACGQDCSGRPRVKNPRGQYLCRPCADERAAASAALAAAPTGPDEADNAYALVPDLLDSRPVASTTPCPECGRPIAPGGIVCTSCGHNTATGATIRTHATTENIPPPSARYHRNLEIERTSAAREYIKPLLMFAIGAGIVAAWIAGDKGPEAGAAYLLRYAINVPIAVAVLFACCLMWIGFDAPMHLQAARLAGIYAVCDLVQHTVNQFPFFGIIAWVAAIMVYIGLVSDMLDLDIQDAVIVALLTFVAKFIVKLTLFAILFAQ